MKGAFYILREDGGVPQGPFSREALSEMAERGDLAAETPVLQDGNWYPYEQLPPALPCPPTYIAWSIMSVFCCFPFSIVALHQSSRVERLHEQGLHEEAQAASRAALQWNLLFSITIFLMLVFCWFCFCYARKAWQEGGNELLQILTEV